MWKIVATLLVASLIVGAGFALGQTDMMKGNTEREVKQTILDSFEYANRNLITRPDIYSKYGALEFWSSGGLVQEVEPGGGRLERYEILNLKAKHIHVITLVEGQAAVAYYYSEGSLQPQGYPAVTHYLTRVSQVFVEEGGRWKIRSSHWSPVAGGSGTSQTAESVSDTKRRRQ